MRDARRRRRFPPARPATRKPPTLRSRGNNLVLAVATGCALLGCLAHCGILSLSRTDGGVSLALRASNITATSALLIVSVVAAGATMACAARRRSARVALLLLLYLALFLSMWPLTLAHDEAAESRLSIAVPARDARSELRRATGGAVGSAPPTPRPTLAPPAPTAARGVELLVARLPTPTPATVSDAPPDTPSSPELESAPDEPSEPSPETIPSSNRTNTTAPPAADDVDDEDDDAALAMETPPEAEADARRETARVARAVAERVHAAARELDASRARAWLENATGGLYAALEHALFRALAPARAPLDEPPSPRAAPGEDAVFPPPRPPGVPHVPVVALRVPKRRRG